jgi:hypothetical protein
MTWLNRSARLIQSGRLPADDVPRRGPISGGVIMCRKLLMSAVAVLTFGAFLTTVPAHADLGRGEQHSMRAESAQAMVMIYGPYATIRRANEVAAEARSLGFSAVVYHNGDGYYVKVW